MEQLFNQSIEKMKQLYNEKPYISDYYYFNPKNSFNRNITDEERKKGMEEVKQINEIPIFISKNLKSRFSRNDQVRPPSLIFYFPKNQAALDAMVELFKSDKSILEEEIYKMKYCNFHKNINMIHIEYPFKNDIDYGPWLLDIAQKLYNMDVQGENISIWEEMTRLKQENKQLKENFTTLTTKIEKLEEFLQNSF